MTRMTVRDVRLQWPKAERALAEGEEIVVTRGGEPVARILPYVVARTRVKGRFNPSSHALWMRKFWKAKALGPSTGEWLKRDRAE